MSRGPTALRVTLSPISFRSHDVKGQLCLTNLLELIQEVPSRIDKEESGIVVCLDFQKYFDKVRTRGC